MDWSQHHRRMWRIGFAIVAVEVRRLAETSQEATSLIARLVGAIQIAGGETGSPLELTVRIRDISKLAEQAGQDMQRTQRDAQALSERIAGLTSHSIGRASRLGAEERQVSGIEDASLETLRKLQSQASETKRLVDYAKTLLQEVGSTSAGSINT